MEPRKNIKSIIKAFDIYHQDYPEIDLLLVGNKGWLYNPLFRLLKKRDYIKYLGFIAGKKRDALYFLSLASIEIIIALILEKKRPVIYTGRNKLFMQSASEH